MEIKDIIRFEDLRRKVIVESIRILNKKGNMEENIRRKWEYIYAILEMFPDSTYVEEGNRDRILNLLSNPFDIMNSYDCEKADPREVSNYIKVDLNSTMLCIAMDSRK